MARRRGRPMQKRTHVLGSSLPSTNCLTLNLPLLSPPSASLHPEGFMSVSSSLKGVDWLEMDDRTSSRREWLELSISPCKVTSNRSCWGWGALAIGPEI